MLPQKTSDLNRRNESYIYVALSVALVLGMSAVALLPSNARHILHTKGRLHSWWHLFAFALVGFLAAKISRSPYQRIFLFLGCLAFGFATEYFEHFIYGIPFETRDLWVDAIGVLLGTAVALLFPGGNRVACNSQAEECVSLDVMQ